MKSSSDPDHLGSPLFTLHKPSSKCLIADKLQRADTFLSRCVGLLNRSSLEENEGLWIEPCQAIHSFGMRFSIDVLFIDSSHTIVAMVERFQPMRVSKHYSKATGVIELKAGSIARYGLQLKDQLDIKPDATPDLER